MQEQEPRRVSVAFELSYADRVIEASADIPDALMRVADMMPLVLALTDAVVGMAASAAEETATVTCGPSCGACCRQLVPVSEAEARYLAERVAEMPPGRRESVKARFQAALDALGPGIIQPLRDTAALKEMESRRKIGLEYFAAHVPCPFIENENCAIYDHRPAACREYLVTSAAAHCANPSAATVRMLTTPKPSTVLYRFGDGMGNQASRWMPLVLALEWAEAHPEGDPRFPGPAMFRNFVKLVAESAKA